VRADRQRLVCSFVRDGLRRGDRVVCLCHDDGAAQRALAAASQDDELRAAIAQGRLGFLNAQRRCPGMRGGELIASVHDEHRRALDDGLAGLSVTGDMCEAVSGVAESDMPVEYERALEELHQANLGMLCLFDHGRLPASMLSLLAAAHDVDVSPELVAIGRVGSLAAGWVRADHALRLAGELDIASAGELSAALAAHFHGPLRLDLADLSFADVVGMRALRGRIGQQLTIVAASIQVRRLTEVLGWDLDPDVAIAPVPA
jgi:anti-anti-sigma regulatory factor